MVYGAINDEGEKFYTNLKNVFDAIYNKQLEYNWLITDFDSTIDDTEIQTLLGNDYCWISGEKLTDLVTKKEFQWIWAVLSAFDKSVSLDEVLEYELPYANGYGDFWEKPLTMQHPLAKIEIVSFDSSFTLIFSENKETIDNFRNFYPMSQNLEQYIDSF